MSDIEATIAERKTTHGDFTDHARITQAMKDLAHRSPSWSRMTATTRESVEMILHKVGRMCAGDPSHPDHLLDIEGYARIARERL